MVLPSSGTSSTDGFDNLIQFIELQDNFIDIPFFTNSWSVIITKASIYLDLSDHFKHK